VNCGGRGTGVAKKARQCPGRVVLWPSSRRSGQSRDLDHGRGASTGVSTKTLSRTRLRATGSPRRDPDPSLQSACFGEPGLRVPKDPPARTRRERPPRPTVCLDGLQPGRPAIARAAGDRAGGRRIRINRPAAQGVARQGRRPVKPEVADSRQGSVSSGQQHRG